MQRISREDLLCALASVQERSAVLAWLIRDGGHIRPGFLFLRSPRDYSGFLVFVDAELSVTYSNSTAMTRAQRDARNADLWRMHSEEGHYFASLLEAMQSEAVMCQLHPNLRSSGRSSGRIEGGAYAAGQSAGRSIGQRTALGGAARGALAR